MKKLPPLKYLLPILLFPFLLLGIDLWFPLGIALGVLYVLPVVGTLSLYQRSLTLLVTMLISALIVLGYWYSPNDATELWKAQVNRALACGVVWVTAWIVLRSIHSKLSLDALRETLEQRIDERTTHLQEQNRAVLNLLQDVECTRKELSKREKLFGLVIEAAPSGMLMINEVGTIVLINQMLEKQFGYTRGELLDQSIECLVPERFRAGHPAYRANFFSAPEPRGMGSNRDLYGLRKDGSEFPVEIGLNPFTTEEGTFVLASVIDITARKQSEATVYQYMNELQRSNQELDDFASIASHDLKEPLRGIFNYSTILLEDYGNQFDEEAKSRCETLLRLSRRMEDLVDALLYFSRVGRTELAKGPTDLQLILDDILDSLRIRLEELGVHIHIPCPLPTVNCDRVRIGEIFRNLITNAMKYNNKDEKWIEIGYVAAGNMDSDAFIVKGNVQEWTDNPTVDPDKQRATSHEIPIFYVRDNGIGIQEKHLSNIFQIFKRLHGRDKFGGGTGAGLTITKKLVERHGGTLWVESTYGEGTTFFFTLQRSVRHGVDTTTADLVG